MTILQDLLSQIKDDDIHVQVLKLCNKIAQEEITKQLYIDKIVLTTNVYLSLEICNNNREYLLTLEREFDGYMCYLYKIVIVKDKNPVLIREKFWQINEKTAEKILLEYAKRYKFLKGE